MDMTYYYVYILRSVNNPGRYYTGFTEDLDARLKEHNQGKCTHTSKYVPWEIKTFVGFKNHEKAIEFEKYLKTSSGRALAKKQL
ncbi:MAG: GIY-YIG nuclease family protein [Sedimentisphaerales bacterium]|nr:GIY-YIG nuclease family protein [Sedimentisphaerales bacterium]